MSHDFATIAQQFVDFYYNTFDTNRAALANLYVGSRFSKPQGDEGRVTDANALTARKLHAYFRDR